jgi:hypothetical protein
MTRRFGIAAALCCLAGFVIVSCSKPNPSANATAQPTPTPAASQPVGDYACTLLTKEEIAAVQGEPFKDTKPSEKTSTGLIVSQCYFELPNTVNSVVLTVTRKAGGGRDPSQSWQEIFHRERRGPEKEEGEKNEPTKVEGLGDEAYWNATRVGGALFVLKGNTYLRISVGGAGNQAEKLEKSKTLAASVLKRL